METIKKWPNKQPWCWINGQEVPVYKVPDNHFVSWSGEIIFRELPTLIKESACHCEIPEWNRSLPVGEGTYCNLCKKWHRYSIHFYSTICDSCDTYYVSNTRNPKHPLCSKCDKPIPVRPRRKKL